jgi:hypothetical protein
MKKVEQLKALGIKTIELKTLFKMSSVADKPVERQSVLDICVRSGIEQLTPTQIQSLYKSRRYERYRSYNEGRASRDTVSNHDESNVRDAIYDNDTGVVIYFSTYKEQRAHHYPYHEYHELTAAAVTPDGRTVWGSPVSFTYHDISLTQKKTHEEIRESAIKSCLEKLNT